MMREFNSISRQLQLYGKLSTLHIESVIAAHKLASFSDALTKIVTIIDTMTPEFPPHFRSEPHNINYFRNAFLRQHWARNPISNIITAQYTFNGFLTALRENMQLEEEIKLTQWDKHTCSPDGTFIQQYGTNSKHVRNFKQGSRSDKPQGFRSFSRDREYTSRSFTGSRRRNECHKWQARWTPGHRGQSGAIRNHVRHRMQNRGPLSI